MHTDRDIIWELQQYHDFSDPHEIIVLAIDEITRLRAANEGQPEVRTNGEIGFGDYVRIEMKRYGADNEFYLHKVIGRSRSSHAAKVPIDSGLDTGTGTDPVSLGGIKDVLHVVQCGVVEDRIFKIALEDVHGRYRYRPTPPESGEA